MQDVNALVERLRTVFNERFHIEVPAADTDLLDSGIVDSLQFVDLLLALEQDFGLRLSIESIELDDLRTLSRLAAIIAAHTGAMPSPHVASADMHASNAADGAPAQASLNELPSRSSRLHASRTVVDVPQDAIAPTLWRPARGAG